MTRKWPEWERYERLIARLIADQIETDYSVTPNAKVRGLITGISRQIDVLIDPRHIRENHRRIAVDAKKKRRKVDVKDVEEFRGLMEDIGATHGYLVCPSGYTKAAERRAQESVFIRVLSLDRLDGFDPSVWPHCRSGKCAEGRVFWDGYPLVTMQMCKLSGVDQGEPHAREFLHYVGKCDRCGGFHVWCRTCNEILFLPEDDEEDLGQQCGCRLPWFWLASVEEDEDGSKSGELHLCSPSFLETVDRRSM